ncbi:hypothetical protein Fcan01_25557 [Folsomia candida]|uniref:Uncharacterized protein n=1 Tax=Folsomia candida TaxID=158441 RepID=A0A226D498_FOLCA|nr:hypothetical protein Fcan01_25557 [Folsomia candida]
MKRRLNSSPLKFFLIIISNFATFCLSDFHQDLNLFEKCHILICIISSPHTDNLDLDNIALIRHPVQLTYPEKVFNNSRHPENDSYAKLYSQILPDFQPFLTKTPLKWKLLTILGAGSQNYFRIVDNFLNYIDSNLLSGASIQQVDIYRTYFSTCLVLMYLPNSDDGLIDHVAKLVFKNHLYFKKYHVNHIFLRTKSPTTIVHICKICFPNWAVSRLDFNPGHIQNLVDNLIHKSVHHLAVDLKFASHFEVDLITLLHRETLVEFRTLFLNTIFSLILKSYLRINISRGEEYFEFSALQRIEFMYPSDLEYFTSSSSQSISFIPPDLHYVMWTDVSLSVATCSSLLGEYVTFRNYLTPSKPGRGPSSQFPSPPWQSF